MLSFGVLIAFWSPKQSEIEESSLESMAKQWKSVRIGYAIIRTGRPDTPSQGRVASHIPPGCLTSGILLRRHSTRMSHIQKSYPSTFHPDILHPVLDAGWERRAFQLPLSNISGSSDSAYPKSFAAILHSAAVFSWSFHIFATNILIYFALDIWCLYPQTLLVTHLS